MSILLVQSKPDIYTTEQLFSFKSELDAAGGFDELMLNKKAIERKNGTVFITLYKDKEDYKEKFLTGIYESLRPRFNTEVPYVFWGKLYELVKKIPLKKEVKI